MRMLLMVLIALPLLFGSCKPMPVEVKPAEISTTDVAPKKEAQETPAKSEDPLGDVGDFSVNTGVNSASSRK